MITGPRVCAKTLRCVLLFFIDPRVRKIRNEASNCPGPGIFSKILLFYYVASFPGEKRLFFTGTASGRLENFDTKEGPLVKPEELIAVCIYLFLFLSSCDRDTALFLAFGCFPPPLTPVAGLNLLR